MSLRATALDDPVLIRQADRDLLSLALIDARNLTLRWLEVFEQRSLQADRSHGRSVLGLCALAGWYQEWWIGRHVQRRRGEHCDPGSPRLPSVEPRSDGWFDAADSQPPDADTVRGYLGNTLDITLELLAAADDSDNALHYHRAALLHEDRLSECLAERAALLRLQRQPDPPPPLVGPPARVPQPALWMPAAQLQLGSAKGGFVPDNERWAEPLAVPEFEIDAQAMSWARFVEFADDGGYDRPELWTDAGRAWLLANARRAPRDVEQMRGGVLLHRVGELQRAPAGQAAVHVSRHEAEAWCRWAGRRLPTEPEWELAALSARNRGFVWGDVFEWVAGSARGWTGHAPTPGSLDRLPPPRSQGVLRGASVISLRRWRHPKARRFAPPDTDLPFCGFRSCAG